MHLVDVAVSSPKWIIVAYKTMGDINMENSPDCIRLYDIGCKDAQTSADVGNVMSFHLPVGMSPGGAGGACTNSMISALEQNPELTIIHLLEQMRQQLVQLGFEQVPQLSTSRPLPLTEKFKEQLLKIAS